MLLLHWQAANWTDKKNNLNLFAAVYENKLKVKPGEKNHKPFLNSWFYFLFFIFLPLLIQLEAYTVCFAVSFSRRMLLSLIACLTVESLNVPKHTFKRLVLHVQSSTFCNIFTVGKCRDNTPHYSASHFVGLPCTEALSEILNTFNPFLPVDNPQTLVWIISTQIRVSLTLNPPDIVIQITQSNRFLLFWGFLNYSHPHHSVLIHHPHR